MVSKKMIYVMHVITLVLVAASYVMNLGWYRVLFAIVFAPYFVIYGALGWLFIKYHEMPIKTVLLTTLSMLSYVGLNLALVDFGDVPPAYACFGLLHVDAQLPNFMLTFAAFVALHMLLVVGQIATTIMSLRKPKNKAITA